MCLSHTLRVRKIANEDDTCSLLHILPRQRGKSLLTSSVPQVYLNFAIELRVLDQFRTEIGCHRCHIFFNVLILLDPVEDGGLTDSRSAEKNNLLRDGRHRHVRRILDH